MLAGSRRLRPETPASVMRIPLLLELGTVKLGVKALAGQKLLMVPLLDHPAAVDDQNLVCILNGGEAVGDDKEVFPFISFCIAR